MSRYYETHVYFILARRCRAVKIGFSINPALRIKEIQTMCPEKLTFLGQIRGSQRSERELHCLLATERLHGEWFKVSPRTYEILFEHLNRDGRYELMLCRDFDDYSEPPIEMPTFAENVEDNE